MFTQSNSVKLDIAISKSIIFVGYDWSEMVCYIDYVHGMCNGNKGTDTESQYRSGRCTKSLLRRERYDCRR